MYCHPVAQVAVGAGGGRDAHAAPLAPDRHPGQPETRHMLAVVARSRKTLATLGLLLAVIAFTSLVNSLVGMAVEASVNRHGGT